MSLPDLNLSQKMGPLPRGAWIAVIGTGLGLGLYLHNKHKAAAAAATDPTSLSTGDPNATDTGASSATSTDGSLYGTDLAHDYANGGVIPGYNGALNPTINVTIAEPKPTTPAKPDAHQLHLQALHAEHLAHEKTLAKQKAAAAHKPTHKAPTKAPHAHPQAHTSAVHHPTTRDTGGSFRGDHIAPHAPSPFKNTVEA